MSDQEFEKRMANTIKGFIALIDDNILVRNTDDDHNMNTFLTNSARLVTHLKAADSVLEEFQKRFGGG